jgi:hypothetical protein
MSECGSGCDASAQAELEDFPFAEVKLLLDMVLGNTPFDFRSAIKAVAAIADYAASLDLFGAQAVDAPCPKSIEVAVLLQAAVANSKAQGGGGIEAQGIWDMIPKKYLLELIIRKVMEWLAERVNESA